MKKHILKIMTLCTVAALALASCKKDNKPQGNVPENGFLASIESNQGNGSRTHLVGSDVLWNAGDQIVVRNGNGATATYRLTSGENTTEGTFLSSEDDNDFFQPTYTAIYPAAVGNTITGEGAATFTLPATQTYLANSFANGAMPMMAVSDEQTLEFKNALGGICFPMVGDGLTVTRLVLTSNSATDHLSGVFAADYNNGQPTLTYTSGGANSITLDCGAGVTLDATTATDFTIMVPVGSLANGFTVTAYNGETAYSELSTTANPNIVRSVISKANQSLEVEMPVIVPMGAINGLYLINANGDKVFFSQGNLQFLASENGVAGDLTHNVAGGGTAQGQWRFAEHQWDHVGNAPGNTAPSATQTNWIDLFNWGTSGWEGGVIAYQPWTTDDWPSHYYPGGDHSANLTGEYANCDWGVYNDIMAGDVTIEAGTYRTLTYAEFDYLFNTRKVTVEGSQKASFGTGEVNGINGLVLLPDNWDGSVCPNFTYGQSSWSNIFSESTETKWSDMEAVGCVFLPAAGIRNHITGIIGVVGSSGFYWTTTYGSITFRSNYGPTAYYIDGRHSSCVRLVHDVN